jgi:hypothetical protein
VSAALTMPSDRYTPDYESAVAVASIAPASDASLPSAVRALEAPPQPPVRFLVHDLIPMSEIVLFVGDGGAFKSSAALHIGGAVAGGYAAFGAYRTLRGPVLVVSNEDSLGVVVMRLEAYCAGHGWSRERVLGNVHVIAEGEPNLSDHAWRAHIDREVERIEPALVLFDPWFEILGADENSNSETRPAIKYLRSLTKRFQCTVGVVHHAGKAGADKRQLDRIRGASSLPHSSRAVFFFEFLPEGIRVENLKMSRAPRLDPFLIKHRIDHESDNRGQWTSARLTLEDARSDADQRAEAFIVSQLSLAAKPITSTDLRKLGTGIRNEDLSKAIARLNALNVIAYDNGRQGAKLWRIVDRSWSGPSDGGNSTMSTDSQPLDPALIQAHGSHGFGSLDPAREKVGRVGQPPDIGLLDPAHLAPSLSGQPPETLVPPLKGGTGSEKGVKSPGQGGQGLAEEINERLEERRGMQGDDA